jgi:hypothetical protein
VFTYPTAHPQAVSRGLATLGLFRVPVSSTDPADGSLQLSGGAARPRALARAREAQEKSPTNRACQGPRSGSGACVGCRNRLAKGAPVSMTGLPGCGEARCRPPVCQGGPVLGAGSPLPPWVPLPGSIQENAPQTPRAPRLTRRPCLRLPCRSWYLSLMTALSLAATSGVSSPDLPRSS